MLRQRREPRRADAQPRAVAVALDGDDLADLLDDAGEHPGTVAAAAGQRCRRPSSSTSGPTSRTLRLAASRRVGQRARRRAAPSSGRPSPPSRRGARNSASASTRPARSSAAGELRAALDQQRGDPALAEHAQRLARASPPRARSTPAGGAGAAAGATRSDRRRAQRAARGRLRPRAGRGGRRRRAAAGAPPAARRRAASARGRRPAPCRCRRRPRPLAARQSCTSLRLSGDEIQRLSPAAVAVRPSRRRRQLEQHERPAVDGVHPERARSGGAPAARCAPVGDLDVDARLAQALEALARRPRGFGSPAAQTTRAMPAAISASAQGGWRPWWLHGSSET